MAFIKLGASRGAVLTVTALGLVACAAPEPSSSTFRNNGKTETAKPGADGTLVTTTAADEFQECATQTATAEAKPIYLVFMFDKSGSMVANGSPKWNSAKAASKAFFESAQSAGVHASLSFFPNEANYSCERGDYSSPNVKMASLPSTSFGASLDGQAVDGGTPTHTALQGAIDYARNVASGEAKGGKVAIVLVTDGLPDSDCSGNSVEEVKQLAASAASTIPTYVVGVGDQLTSLKEIAIGGGTNKAFIVNTSNAAQIQADFLAAVNAIKDSALSCDYDIPAPPSGEQLDRSKVNVVYKAGSASETIGYNQACTGGTGWRYDDANAPKRILLCDSSCEGVKAKPGQVDVLFGCATKVTVK